MISSKFLNEDKDWEEFQQWKNSHGRNYANAQEESDRFANFKKSKALIFHSGSMAKKYKVVQGLQLRTQNNPSPLKRLKPEFESMNFDCLPNSVNFELNKFSDISEDDFAKQYSDIDEEKIKKIKERGKILELQNKELPKKFIREEIYEVKKNDFDNAKNIFILNSQDEEMMKAALVEKGNLIVAVPLEHIRFIKAGIFDYWFDFLCRENKTITLTIVGYDSQCGVDYWILRSPFGEDWGQGGYFKMRRGINMCQISNFVAIIE